MKAEVVGIHQPQKSQMDHVEKLSTKELAAIRDETNV